MTNDPIVEAIHRTREKLLEEAGGDIDVLFDRLNAIAELWPSRKVTLEQPREESLAPEVECVR